MASDQKLAFEMCDMLFSMGIQAYHQGERRLHDEILRRHRAWTAVFERHATRATLH